MLRTGALCCARLPSSLSKSQVVPLYCFDPRHYGTTPYGSKKTGDYRAKFLLESVQDLRQQLLSIGSNLLIHMGSAEEALKGKIIVTCINALLHAPTVATSSIHLALYTFVFQAEL